MYGETGSDGAERASSTGTTVTEGEPDRALTFLRERLTEGRTGPGRLILVSGGVASGKTRLLDEFLDGAVRDGVRALGATGSADERDLAGGVIDQLLAGPDLPPAAAEEAAHTMAACADTGRRRAAGASGAASPDLTHAVWRLARALLAAARERPTVLVVDDVHLADSASLLLLTHLQRRLRPTRLTMVLALRDTASQGDRAPRPDRHTVFTRHPHHHLRLAPLTERAVREMLDGRAGDGAAARIHHLAAGNPLLAGALAEDCLTTGDIGAVPAAGGAFTRALTSYLDRWDLPLTEVAGVLAVHGGRVPAPLLAALVGIEPGVAGAALDALTRSGLLADGRFRHAAVESAVLAGLPPEARTAAQLRSAEAKFRQSAPPREVAAHLVAAGSAPAHWTVPVLRAAAGQAVADNDPDFAVRCLELALTAADTTAGKRLVLAELAHHTWRMAPSASRRYLQALRRLPADDSTPPTRTEAAAVARQALWEGDEPGWRASRRTLAAMAPDSRTGTGLHLAHTWWFGPREDGSPTQAESAAPSGPDAPAEPPADDPWRLAATALSGMWARPGDSASTDAAERLLRSCRLADDTLEALMTAVLALVHAGRTRDAETWWRSLKAEADRRGAVTWQAVLTGMWSSAVLRSGDVSYAADLARHALSLLPAEDWGAAICDPLGTLLLAWTEAEEYERAADLLTHPLPDGVLRTLPGVRFLRARGHYLLATGQLLAAVADFSECGRLLTALGTDLPAVAPWRADLAAARLALGDEEAARRLAAGQLALAAETDGCTRGLALRVLALTGDPGELRGTLRQAAGEFTECGHRWEAYRTSRMLDRVPQRRAAAQAPRTPGPERGAGSRSVASVSVLPRLSATARTEPESSGADTLSTAELRVAELAALGRTNLEISGSLSITVSTVEQHLTRVYRKLGIRGRSQLAAHLAPRE
ncbi:AAA family ATPase [Streptomyces sp. NPDC093248]|uniref:helix-turn-helix transcriptional regulator n=1 Tax=Streptomyces sp. NPDC093248 TaxID=3155072 RepID=UPI0034311BB7